MTKQHNKILDRESILQADDLKKERLSMPEWGGDIFIRTMTGAERDAFEEEVIVNGKADAKNIRARLCVRVIVDEDGNRIFSDSDAEALGSKSTHALERVADVAQMLNSMTDNDVEELKKTSEAVHSENSTSD
jgi:hypothetical protein